jgi:2-dehydro-3-deoxygluconokinase
VELVNAAKSFDVVALGEALIEFNQTDPGAPTYLQGFGGDTSNALIAAVRQGARGAYVTRVGDDDFGRMLLELWHAERVDTRGVAIDGKAPTGIYFVRHGEGGHAFSYLRAGSAASRIQPADVPRELIAGTRFLHVSGISQAISPSATETVLHATKLARELGACISYDPNLRLKLWSLERARAVITAMLPLADYFLPSVDDAQAISGLDDEAAILDWCHAKGAGTVVLKKGREGAVVSGDAARTRIEAYRVDTVDATGAGDCFDGAFIARLAAGDDSVSAARWASAAAALKTTGYGAVAPLPTAKDVAEFIEQRA